MRPLPLAQLLSPLLALLGAGLVPAHAAALELSDPLACPAPAELREALTRHAGELPGRLVLGRTAHGRVAVRWSVGERTFTRTLDVAERDCAAAAETVALLVDAWHRELPTAAHPDPLDAAIRVHPVAPPPHAAVTPPPAPAPEPLPMPDAGATIAQVPQPTPTLDAGPPPEVVVSPDAGAALAMPLIAPRVPDVAPAPADAGSAFVMPSVAMREPEATQPPVRPEVKAPAPEAAPVTSNSKHLALGLEGRAALGFGPGTTLGAGAVDAELALSPHLALHLDVGLDTSLSQARDPGSVNAQRATLGLGARTRFHPFAASSAHALRLGGGLFLERLAASAQGFASTSSRTVYAPGLALEAAWELELGHGLALGLGPRLELVPERTHFVIDNLGTVLEVPVFWAGLALGLQWRLF